MGKMDAIKQIWAGIFFILGLVAVCGVIYFIGFNKGMTQPRFEMVALFDKVGGLIEGAPVRLSGVMVGTVRDIDFVDEDVMGRSVKVSLDIFKKYEKPVRRATAIGIRTEGVLGAKYVEISHKPGRLPLATGGVVMGDPMLDVYDLAEVLQETAESFNQTTVGINSVMGEIRNISRKTKRVLDRVEQRVIDGNLFKVF